MANASTAYTRLARRAGGSGAYRSTEAQLWLRATVYEAPPLNCEEALLQAKVEKLLEVEGYEFSHASVTILDRPGWPDLEAARVANPGRSRPATHFHAELKTMTGALSAHQKRVCAALVAAGVPVFLWRPCDWATIVEVVRSGDTSRGAATLLKTVSASVGAANPTPKATPRRTGNPAGRVASGGQRTRRAPVRTMTKGTAS